MCACIEVISGMARPADLSVILRALSDLSVLVNVFMKPDAIVRSVQLLADMLTGYPADVSLDAVRSWPHTPAGDRWPTLKQLTEACEARMALRTRLSERFSASIDDAPTAAVKPKNGPTGQTLMFVHECRRKLGDGWVASWLERSCVFSATEIKTGGYFAARIKQDAGRILAEHKEVKLTVDENAARLARAGAA